MYKDCQLSSFSLAQRCAINSYVETIKHNEARLQGRGSPPAESCRTLPNMSSSLTTLPFTSLLAISHKLSAGGVYTWSLLDIVKARFGAERQSYCVTLTAACLLRSSGATHSLICCTGTRCTMDKAPCALPLATHSLAVSLPRCSGKRKSLPLHCCTAQLYACACACQSGCTDMNMCLHSVSHFAYISLMF